MVHIPSVWDLAQQQDMQAHPEDIAAISSGHSTAALKVIRVSGWQFISKLNQLFTAPLIAKKINVTKLLDSSGSNLDDCVVLWFPAPHSYTGEHLLEITIHGNPIIANNVMQRLAQLGIREAMPGEFSERRYINGKATLTESIATNQIIHAKSQMSLDIAQKSINSEFSTILSEIRNKILQLRSQIEAQIDFSDEDISPHNINQLIKQAQFIIACLKNLSENIKKSMLIYDGIDIVMIGDTNVGKSSCMNYFSGRDVALVTDIAGTTRDKLEVNLDVNGYSLRLIDTAGLRSGSHSQIEQMGILKAKKIAETCTILAVLQTYNQYLPIDQKLKQLNIQSSALKLISIVTKCDLASQQQLNEIRHIETINNSDLIFTSAKNDTGFAGFCSSLQGFLQNGEDQNLGVGNQNQYDNIVLALHDCKEALAILEHSPSQLDEISQCLSFASTNLSALCESLGYDDVLSEIFRTFCIGK